MRQKGEFDLVLSKEERGSQAGLASPVLEGTRTLRPYRLGALCEENPQVLKVMGKPGFLSFQTEGGLWVDPGTC